MKTTIRKKGWGTGALLCLLTANAWAYDFRDAIRDSAPKGEGLENVIEFFEYVRSLNDLVGRYVDASGEVDLDFRDPDLSRLYDNKHFTRWEDDFHGVAARVNTSPGVISLGFISREEAGRGAEDLEGFGSFTTEFSLKKNHVPETRTTSNIVVAEGRVHSGSQDWMNILRFLEGLLKTIDPDNLDHLRAEAGLRADEPMDIRDLFWETFPTYHRKGSGIDVTTLSDVKTVNGKRYNDFTADIHFRIEELTERFPRVAKYIKRLQNQGHVNITFKNDDDQTLGEVFLDSGRTFLRISGCSSGGSIIPVDRAAASFTPVEDNAFSPTTTRHLDWKATVLVFHKIAGIRVRSMNIELTGVYENKENDMRFEMRMSRTPDIYVSGTAFGLFPIWIVEMLMPEPVQTLLRRMFAIMHRANDGDGSWFRVHWRKESDDFAWFHWKAQTEILENDYLLMGSRLAIRYFRMNNKTLREFNRFFAGELQYVLEDLRAMK